MIIKEEQRQELLLAAQPLMRWLGKNCHPHVTVIVDSEMAELLEGLATVHKKECVTSYSNSPS